MSAFPLTIVTLDGSVFEGMAEKLFCRTIGGDIGILARHIDFCTALGMGDAHVVFEDGSVRHAACMGGLVTVLHGEVRLIATTWEWAETIDKARAEASRARAEKLLSQDDLNDRQRELAKARLKRALVRSSVAK